MKHLVFTLMIFSTSVFAGQHGMTKRDWEKMPFDQHKKMMQEKLDMKSSAIDASRACVNSAKDNAALMDCHMKMKEEKQAMEEDMYEKKEMKKNM